MIAAPRSQLAAVVSLMINEGVEVMAYGRLDLRQDRVGKGARVVGRRQLVHRDNALLAAVAEPGDERVE
jgi:hypothetical protein